MPILGQTRIFLENPFVTFFMFVDFRHCAKFLETTFNMFRKKKLVTDVWDKHEFIFFNNFLGRIQNLTFLRDIFINIVGKMKKIVCQMAPRT